MSAMLPILWIRAEKYSELSGEPMDTIQTRIRDGSWAEGLQYKRTGPRTLWINLEAVTKWIQNHPHVEAAAPPKALKSVRDRVASV